MTPAELKSARRALGLSAEGMARVMHVASGRTVRRWESGTQDIPGPVVVLATAILAVPALRAHLGLDIASRVE